MLDETADVRDAREGCTREIGGDSHPFERVVKTGRNCSCGEGRIPWIASDTTAKKVLAKDENRGWMFFARYEDSGRWEGERLQRQEEIASNLLNASQSRDINHAIRERKQ